MSEEEESGWATRQIPSHYSDQLEAAERDAPPMLAQAYRLNGPCNETVDGIQLPEHWHLGMLTEVIVNGEPQDVILKIAVPSPMLLSLFTDWAAALL